MGLIWLLFVVCYLIQLVCTSLNFVCLQMYLKKPGSIPESFGSSLELL